MFISPRISKIFLIFSLNIIAFSLLTFSIFSYLHSPDFVDHIEPRITLGSQLILEGMPLYTDPQDQNVYSLLYGPSTYLLQAPFLKVISNPILSSKLFGISMYALAILFMAIVLIRRFSRLTAFLGIPYFIFLSLIYNQSAFWNRPDSVLLMALSGLTLSLTLPSTFAIACGGFFIAIACNAKIHAAFYILPVLAYMYLVERKSLKFFLGLGIVSGLFTLLLFTCFSSISLSAYLFWTFSCLNSTFHPEILKRYLNDFMFFLLPPFILVPFLPSFKGKTWMYVYATFGVSFLVITSSSLKEGAGAWHLLPFAPFVSFLFCSHFDTFYSLYHTRFTKWIFPGALSITLFLSLAFYTQWHSIQKWIIQHKPRNVVETQAALSELLQIREQKKGYTLSLTSKKPFFSPLLFQQNKAFLLSPPAIQDMNHVKLALPEASYIALANETIDFYITNTGSIPFDIGEGYPGDGPIFNARFQSLFQTHYLKYETGTYFDVWISKTLYQKLSKKTLTETSK